jgi:nucleoside-diphosphate-sugar epimerase
LSSGDVYRAKRYSLQARSRELETTLLTESSAVRDRLYPYRGVHAPGVHDFDYDHYDKLLVERIVLNDRDLPATILRLAMVYGPGARQAMKRWFFVFLKRMDDGRPQILVDQRTAKWRAPWGYVGDVAEAVRLAGGK